MAATAMPVTIVGGGPSGLAIAACLHQLSIPYTLLEREDCFAPMWEKYAYDRLHIHLGKDLCHLPLMPIPDSYPKYLSKDDFLRYLKDYVSKFSIRPNYRRLVGGAAYDAAAGNWKVDATNLATGEAEEYRSRFLVVATGESCDPRVPDIEGLGDFAGEVLHSTRYKNGERFRGKDVLVVGCGNSGMEIALDLSNYGARTSVVVRSPIHILSREMVYIGGVLLNHLPFNWVDSLATLMSKAVFGDLSKYGIQRAKEGPFTCKAKYGRYPVIDIGTWDKIKSGDIKVLPSIRRIKGNKVIFENEEEQLYDVIVLATGFKSSAKQWLKGDNCLLNEDGLTKAKKCKGENGLYSVGLGGRGLYGVAVEAQSVAQDIKTLLL